MDKYINIENIKIYGQYNINDINLHFINWCKQFINETSNFIDIGDNSIFSLIMSKECNMVYSFLTYNEYTILQHNIQKNNITNINNSNLENLNSNSNFENITFIRITGDNILNKVKSIHNILINNNYPPFLIKYNKNDLEYNFSLFEYIKTLGYKIVNILNIDDYILICDHHLRFLCDDDFYDKIYNKYILNIDTIPWNKWNNLGNKIVNEYLGDFEKNISKLNIAYECFINSLNNIDNKDIKIEIYENIAKIALYIDKKDEGLNVCENIILSSYDNFDIKNNILLVYSTYMKRLPFKKRINLLVDINNDNLDEYKESSPSIIKYENGYKCNVRLVNYTIDYNGRYILKDNIVRTRNKLLTLDNNLNIIDQVELINKTNIKYYDSNCKGLEDIRFFVNNSLDKSLDKSLDNTLDKSLDKGYFFCTSLEFNVNRTPQMCYGQYDISNGNITKIIPIKINDEVKCEKNWMPLMIDNQVYFIYTIHPFKLYHLNEITNEVSLVKEVFLAKENLSEFRGSAPLIKYRNGWLGTIHQVHYNTQRKYFHRFIWFDLEFKTIKYSKLFYFENVNIEYNLSICHSDHGLLMTYSQNDNTAKIGLIDYNIVDDYLNNC